MYQERDHNTDFLACNEIQNKVTSVQSCDFGKLDLVLYLGKTCFISNCRTTTPTRTTVGPRHGPLDAGKLDWDGGQIPCGDHLGYRVLDATTPGVYTRGPTRRIWKATGDAMTATEGCLAAFTEIYLGPHTYARLHNFLCGSHAVSESFLSKDVESPSPR